MRPAPCFPVCWRKEAAGPWARVVVLEAGGWEGREPTEPGAWPSSGAQAELSPRRRVAARACVQCVTSLSHMLASFLPGGCASGLAMTGHLVLSEATVSPLWCQVGHCLGLRPPGRTPASAETQC